MECHDRRALCNVINVQWRQQIQRNYSPQQADGRTTRALLYTPRPPVRAPAFARPAYAAWLAWLLKVWSRALSRAQPRPRPSRASTTACPSVHHSSSTSSSHTLSSRHLRDYKKTSFSANPIKTCNRAQKINSAHNMLCIRPTVSKEIFI